LLLLVFIYGMNGNLEPPQYFCLYFVDYISAIALPSDLKYFFLKVLFKAILKNHVLLKHLPQTSEARTHYFSLHSFGWQQYPYIFWLNVHYWKLFSYIFQICHFQWWFECAIRKKSPTQSPNLCTGLHDWSSFKAQAVQECFGLPHRETHLFSICSIQNNHNPS